MGGHPYLGRAKGKPAGSRLSGGLIFAAHKVRPREPALVEGHYILTVVGLFMYAGLPPRGLL